MAKPGELIVRWSKKERDILFDYGGGGAGSSDGHWMHSWLTWHKGFDDTFLNELENRGFDIKTLRITMKRK